MYYLNSRTKIVYSHILHGAINQRGSLNYFNKRSRIDRYPGGWRSLRPLIIRPVIIAEHANWPRDVMAFPKWLLQHVMPWLVCRYTNPHTIVYHPHPRQSDKQCISDLQSFKKRLRILYTLHLSIFLSVRLSLLSLSPSMPLIPWYLGCINKIVEKIVFAHFLLGRGGRGIRMDRGFALFSIGLFYLQINPVVVDYI